MIDTHCHIDLYPDPISLANECERLGVITIGVTNLPSHFERGHPHLRKNRYVRLALGLHPLYAEEHKNEFPLFIKNLSSTSYIGEVGLDFSKEGIATKEIQVETFGKILSVLRGQQKVISLHSRKAESVVLGMLVENKISCAIFHWYSGPLSLIESITSAGYYLSVNPAMVVSKSGSEIIRRIPKEKILTESDGPFVTVKGQAVRPNDVQIVIGHLSKLWNISQEQVEMQIKQNFFNLIASMRRLP